MFLSLKTIRTRNLHVHDDAKKRKGKAENTSLSVAGAVKDGGGIEVNTPKKRDWGLGGGVIHIFIYIYR